MEERRLTGGRLRSARFDARAGRLEITFNDHSVRVWQGVPAEVWRRLLAAPNPGAYFDDRIAEEYPKGRPMNSGADPAGGEKLSDLFGGAD
jgi:hypothetical protein